MEKKSSKYFMKEGLNSLSLFPKSRGVFYLKVMLLGTVQQWPTAARDISHAGHEQERGVVGEDRVKEPKPLITGQNL